MASKTLWRLGVISRRSFTRTFTTTSCVLRITGPLPVFRQSSNPELDTILDNFRTQLVIPTHLTKQQRDLVNRPEHHASLLAEPIIVTIHDENICLAPNPRPNLENLSNSQISKTINAMLAPSDLDNIPPFLLGLKDVGFALTERHKMKIARTCNLKGRVDILMEIVRNAKKYNFLLTKAVARECMRGLIVQHNIPGKDSTVKALKRADGLMAAFANSANKVDPRIRLKRDPVVVGTAISLFADTCLNYSEGKDVGGRTMKLCRFLQYECWEGAAQEWDLGIPPEVPRGKNGRREYYYTTKAATMNWTPVLEGLVGAKQLLATTGIYSWIDGESTKLAMKIAEWNAFLEANVGLLKGGGDVPRMSVDVYRDVAMRIHEEREAAKAAAESGEGGEEVDGEVEPLDDDELTPEQKAELEALEKGM